MSTRLTNIELQKQFIVENASILTPEIKSSILTIVSMEIGPSVIFEKAKDTDIDLDAISEINEEIIVHIYNIVWARRESLKQPLP